MDNFERLRTRPTRTVTVTMALDPDDTDEFVAARRKVEAARNRLAGVAPDQYDDAATELALAEEAMEAVEAEHPTFTVHLRGVGPARVEELMYGHRPTDAQRKRARALNGGDPKSEPQWNDDTFPPAMLAEAVAKITFSDDPEHPLDGLSLTQATDLWSARWSIGDRSMIFNAAMMLDQSLSQVGDLGKG